VKVSLPLPRILLFILGLLVVFFALVFFYPGFQRMAIP